MRIPHLEPIKFAQNILSVNENVAKVICKFNKIPTLAMFFEAAAQSSAAFSQDDEIKIGFLISLKEVKLLEKSQELDCLISVEKKVEFNGVCEFNFSAYSIDEKRKLAIGTLTVLIQE